MENIKLQNPLQRYEKNIKTAAWIYYRLWPSQHYDVDDLMQAGRMAVWKISERCPERLSDRSYLNAAIRYEIFGVMKQFSPKRKEIHLVSQYDYDEGDERVALVDLLGVKDKEPERFEELEELLYHIKNNFSEGEKYSSNLVRLIESCDDIYNLNLSKPPETELKDRVRVVTRMDLSDEELFIWAEVLLGIRERFPRNYIFSHTERARKYVKNLIQAMDISPEEFALSSNKSKILYKYKLAGFYRIYNNNMTTLLRDVFNLEAYEIWKGKKWEGEKGLLNAYTAIGELAEKTGKKPIELKKEDFIENGLGWLLHTFFNNSYKKAVGFRFPGTYQKIAQVRLHLIKPSLKGEKSSLSATAKNSPFSDKTIRRWVEAYRKHGIEGLKLEPRSGHLDRYVQLITDEKRN